MEWHPDNGCWQMSDDWFDKYVYMATVDLRFFPQEELVKIVEGAKSKFVVKPWDAFGTVAVHSGCAHCNHKASLRKQLLPK